MKHVPGFLSLFLAMSLIAAVSGCAATAVAPKPAFAPGQLWSINSPQPTTTKVVVGRVESWNGSVAVHVSLIDVPVPSGAPNAGALTTVGHMPFEQSALAASVDQVLAQGVSPPSGFEAGYREWQANKGGIFTISVAKAVDIMFETLTRRPPDPERRANDGR
jgi:hypothetical protein